MFFFFCCANPVAPPGGPKDTLPPRVLHTVPPNRSINTIPERVIIYFDEFVQLDNPSQHITINPPINKEINYLVKGKKMIIRLPKEKLAENTTYTIRFGGAVKDFNEGNVQDSFYFVFSTGAYLDSLRIKGQVIQAETGKAEEAFLVGLYPNGTEKDKITDKKPVYYTRTDRKGHFLMEHVKPGQYRLIGFKDENYNYLPDLPEERIAFYSEVLPKSDSVSPILLRSFPQAGMVQATEIRVNQPAHISVIFSAPPSQVAIRTLTDSLPAEVLTYVFNNRRDSLNIFYRPHPALSDSLLLTINGAIADTFKLPEKFTQIDSLRILLPSLQCNSKPQLFVSGGTKGIKKTTSSSVQATTVITQDYFMPFYLYWNRPATLVSRETTDLKMTLFLIKDTLKLPVSYRLLPMPENIIWGVYPENNTWQQQSTYELTISDSVFIDQYQLFNTASKFRFTTTQAEAYGSVWIRVDSLKPAVNYLAELVSTNNQIVARSILLGKETQTIHFQNVIPGKYLFRLVEDTNNNHSWDTGDILAGDQPEHIIIFPDPVEVRAKWETEISFQISDFLYTNENK